MTETGKTSLARNLCAHYRRKDFETIVLDPLRDPRWGASFITSDGDEFLDICKRSKKCMLFMDEGSESVGRYDTEMQWTATQARHWGHSSHFISQGAIQLAPIIRDQCTHVFLFCSGIKSGKLLAEEFNAPDLEICTSLKRGEYFHAVKGGVCTFHSSLRSYDNAFTSHVTRERNFRDRRSAGAQEKTRKVDGDSNSGGGGAITSGDDGQSGGGDSGSGGDGD